MRNAAAAAAKSLQSCPTLCHPLDGRLTSSSVPGILQARILEWVAISFSRRSFQPKDQTGVSCISCIGRQILYHWANREAQYIINKFPQVDIIQARLSHHKAKPRYKLRNYFKKYENQKMLNFECTSITIDQK